MDRNEVRRRALLGAAKVAFSATLVGCGGITIVDARDMDDGSGGASPAGDVATTSGSPPIYVTVGSTGSGVAANACGLPAAAPYAADTVACCDGLLKETFPDGAPPVETVSSDVVACCNVALEVRDVEKLPETVTGNLFPWNVAYECCSVPGVEKTMPFSATCTPWGPPAPPAMPDELDWLEEVA